MSLIIHNEQPCKIGYIAFFWGSITSTVSFVYSALDRYFCFVASNTTLFKVNRDIYKVGINGLPINSHVKLHIQLTFQISTGPLLRSVRVCGPASSSQGTLPLWSRRAELCLPAENIELIEDFGGNGFPVLYALVYLGSVGAEVQAWDPTEVSDLVMVFQGGRQTPPPPSGTEERMLNACERVFIEIWSQPFLKCPWGWGIWVGIAGSCGLFF